jgi:hypothetical protein
MAVDLVKMVFMMCELTLLFFNSLWLTYFLMVFKRCSGVRLHLYVIEKMEREMGFEPPTSSLGIQTLVELNHLRVSVATS